MKGRIEVRLSKRGKGLESGLSERGKERVAQKKDRMGTSCFLEYAGSFPRTYFLEGGSCGFSFHSSVSSS